jgi:hypothetical protein
MLDGPEPRQLVHMTWNETNMDRHSLLSLTDALRTSDEAHFRYRRHLYLDRNQSFGEIQFSAKSNCIAKLECMMKLLAKQWKADTSIFHFMMSKETSVHVFCFKGRMHEQRLAELTTANELATVVSSGLIVSAVTPPKVVTRRCALKKPAFVSSEDSFLGLMKSISCPMWVVATSPRRRSWGCAMPNV